MSLLDLLGLGRPATARVEPARPDHAERLAAIHAGAFARPWDAGDFESFLIDRSVRVDALFVGRDPEPDGFVVSRQAADEAEILSLALARSARGRGHADRLLRRHLATLATGGVATVHLEVEEGNDPAIRLYGRVGFTQSGRRPDYYARPDGTRASALSMSLAMADFAAGR